MLLLADIKNVKKLNYKPASKPGVSEQAQSSAAMAVAAGGSMDTLVV